MEIIGKAVRIYETGGPKVLKYEDVSFDRPKKGQVRLKHHAIGLNFIDINMRNGAYNLKAFSPDAQAPYILGMEGSGEIESIGEDVVDFKVGDRVTHCMNLGAYSEIMNIPANRLIHLPSVIWTGSKACKKKNLISPQWLRNIKDKSYPLWRVDMLFSNNKYHDISIIKEGGWHFSYLKTPEDIEKKLKAYLHHREYDVNPAGIEKIKKMINEKKTIYNLKVDMRTNKFDGGNELKKIDLNLLPSYISNNKNKFSDWIED